MFANIALEVIAAAAIGRFIHRHRRHHGGGGCHGGRGFGRHFGRGGFGPFGGFGGHHFGGHGGCGHHHLHQVFRLVRELGLDATQREELKAIWSSARDAKDSMRFDGLLTMKELIDVVASEPLDQVRLDELAVRHGESHTAAAKQIAAAIGRVSQTLRPEQRDKLRQHLIRWGVWAERPASGGGAPPATGGDPYRTPPTM